MDGTKGAQGMDHLVKVQQDCSMEAEKGDGDRHNCGLGCYWRQRGKENWRLYTSLYLLSHTGSPLSESIWEPNDAETWEVQPGSVTPCNAPQE